MKANNFCASKIQRLDRHRIDIPIPKRRNRKEGRVTDPKKVQNVVQQTPWDLYAQDNLLCFHALPSDNPLWWWSCPCSSAGHPHPHVFWWPCLHVFGQRPPGLLKTGFPFCNWGGSPVDFWIPFMVILPLSCACNQIALWSHPYKSQEAQQFSSFLPISFLFSSNCWVLFPTGVAPWLTPR